MRQNVGDEPMWVGFLVVAHFASIFVAVGCCSMKYVVPIVSVHIAAVFTDIILVAPHVGIARVD